MDYLNQTIKVSGARGCELKTRTICKGLPAERSSNINILRFFLKCNTLLFNNISIFAQRTRLEQFLLYPIQ